MAGHITYPKERLRSYSGMSKYFNVKWGKQWSRLEKSGHKQANTNLTSLELKKWIAAVNVVSDECSPFACFAMVYPTYEHKKSEHKARFYLFDFKCN